MKIVHITPGTGSFYCGSCLRDNALVTALRGLGHTVKMVPLYLPLKTDEPDAAAGEPILFGAVNIYLQQKLSLFRHTPRAIDRLFDARALLDWTGTLAGSSQPELLGDMTLSMLRGEDGRQAKEVARLATHLMAERADVVCLSNALLVGLARQLKARLGIPVACTLQGEEPFLDALPPRYREEAWQTLAERAADVDRWIAVSRYHADRMSARLKLPSERVSVVHNGIRLDDYSPAAASPDPPVVGYLARLCRDKGLHTLVAAFVRLAARHPSLRLAVAGVVTSADEAYVAEQLATLENAGLRHRLDLRPNLDRADKQAFLRGLSVLSVPATYGESFGLYVLEALASGVPVVEPDHGGLPEIVRATGGGVLCAPDDPDALAEALHDLLTDEPRRRALAVAGRQAVITSFHAERMAREFADALPRAAP